MAYLLLYVDDIVLTASYNKLLQHIIEHLHGEFVMKDLIGALSFFLGIHVTRTVDGFSLNQSKYAEEVLERAGMPHCKPAAILQSTPSPSPLHLDGKPADKCKHLSEHSWGAAVPDIDAP